MRRGARCRRLWALLILAVLPVASVRAEQSDPLPVLPAPKTQPDPDPTARAEPAGQAEPFTIVTLEPPAGSAGGSTARPADEAPEPPPGPREPQAEWYGWQTLSSDGGAIGLIALGASSIEDGGGVVAAAGVIGLALVPPIIHWAHGNRWGYGSLALRLGSVAMVSAGVLNALVADCDSDFEDCSGTRTATSIFIVGGLAVMVAAVIADAALGRSEPRPDAPSVSVWGDPRSRSAGVSLTLTR